MNRPYYSDLINNTLVLTDIPPVDDLLPHTQYMVDYLLHNWLLTSYTGYGQWDSVTH